MKKIFILNIVICFSLFCKAQQGFIGINNSAPTASLDITANPNDTGRPDGLLVPRMTRNQLSSKDSSYMANQNGALIFVTALDGTVAGKTVNVTATGLYYYNSQTNTWIAIDRSISGGLQQWRDVRGSVNNLPSTTTSYTIQPTDYVVVFSASSTMQATFPNLTNTAADIGRTVIIVNNSSNTTVGLTVAGTTTTGGGLGGGTLVRGMGLEYIWNGARWFAIV